ncbi:MAG: NADPH-dependent FMN reductase [Bacillota bacterium]
MTKPIYILGISGSLRRKSFNSAALRAAQTLTPPGTTFEIADLSDIPMYNGDVHEQGYPAAVQALRARIAAADAVLIATPEYNYSIPGPLKNALDWASRAPSQPFDGKPLAIMGATAGGLGTSRAQYHLRQVCVYLNALVLNKPEVMISGANAKFDQDGRLTDEATAGQIQGLVQALADWTIRLKAAA